MYTRSKERQKLTRVELHVGLEGVVDGDDGKLGLGM
jgi:hypothetical protein